MKKLMMKMAVVLSAVLTIGMFCGCEGDKAETTASETVSTMVTEAQEDITEEAVSGNEIAKAKTEEETETGDEAETEEETETGDEAKTEEEDEAGDETETIEVLQPQIIVEEYVEEYTDESTEPVELTVPAQFIDEETTQESLEANLAEGVSSAKLNNDGSVTYVMTGEAHTKMVRDERDNVVASLELMVESGDYPSFRKIEHNSDFTEFIVKVDTDELDMAEAVSTLGFFMLGEEYNAYVGEEPENIRVKYVNIDSGTVIEQADSKDMSAE